MTLPVTPGVTPIPTETPPPPLQSAEYFYDGDGNMVKAVVNDVVTYYPGRHYNEEVDNSVSTVKKFYTMGSTTVAVRTVSGTEDVLNWILGDHYGAQRSTPVAQRRGLGSASVTANDNGSWNSEIEYCEASPKQSAGDTAFGEVRTSSGLTPTEYRYTDQLNQNSLGLYFYVARWYDPYLNQFVQPDTVVPEVGNTKAFNRYAYAEWNPIRYSDPSGHFIFEDVWQEPGNHSYTTGPYTHGETYFYSPSSAEEIWGIEVSIRVSQQTANDPTGFGGVIGIGAAMTPIAIQSAITNQPTYYSNDFENIIKRLGDDIVPQGNTGRTHANPPEKVLNLPIRNTAREKTSGVLIVDGKEYVLISGRNGPASEIPLGSSGFNGITKTHVEGHAAAIMKQNSSTYGTLWINNTPCESCNPHSAPLRVLQITFLNWWPQ